MTTVEEVSAVDPIQRPTAATSFATGVVGMIAVVVALLSALTTFMVLANLTFVNPTPNVVVTLLAVNFVTVLLLLAIIGREVWHIVQARRRGRAAARLHVQIAGLFAAAPSIALATLGLTIGADGKIYAATEARSMIAGALAFFLYAYLCSYLMLRRNLVYTGITRAKQLVVLVGQRRALAIAGKDSRAETRWSKLKQWLCH